MNTNELKEYLKDVYELEQQKYTCQRLEALYDEARKEFQQPSSYILATRPNNKGKLKSYKVYREDLESIPCKGPIPESWGDHPEITKASHKMQKSESLSKIWGILAIIIPIVAIAVTVIIELSNRAFISDIIFEAIVIGVFFGLVGLALWTLGSNRYFKNSDRFHKKCIEIYTKLWDEAVIPFNEERKKMAQHLSNEKSGKIIPAKNTTKSALEQLYSLNILHPKYRNLIAVAQIYEYLDTGRCCELEGPNGAYNLFESELRQNIIIAKLDVVIEKLEEVKEAMYNVVSAINRTNSLLTSISNEISQINSNTALVAYKTQCISYSTAATSKYNL